MSVKKFPISPVSGYENVGYENGGYEKSPVSGYENVG